MTVRRGVRPVTGTAANSASRGSDQRELSGVKLLRRLRRRLGPATLKGVGVGTVIAAVHLDAPNAVALSHRSAQRRLEFVPVPATGPWRGTDEEVDQLVEECLFGVAPSLSGEGCH
jgi:hypothetical protein